MKTPFCKLILLGLLSLVCFRSLAFESLSAYRRATSPSQDNLQSYRQWDSEASSDLLAYLRPIEWDFYFTEQKRIFDMSVGSISSKQFLDYQRLKIEEPLTQRLSVRLLWWEQRDFEQDHQNQTVELRFRLAPEWTMAGFTQLSLNKAENDIGASLEFSHDQILFEGTVLLADFQRNQRTLDGDRWWPNRDPLAFTLNIRNQADASLARWQGTVHYEPKADRRFSSGARQEMSRSMIQFQSLLPLDVDWRVEQSILADSTFVSDSNVGEDPAIKRLRLLSRQHLSFWLGPHQMRAGMAYMYRQFQTVTGSWIRRDLLPYFWFEFPRRHLGEMQHSFSFGLDATWSDLSQANLPLGQSDQDTKIEGRSNFVWNLWMSKAAWLRLTATFDLDRLGGEQSFEGGNGQFQLTF